MTRQSLPTGEPLIWLIIAAALVAFLAIRKRMKGVKV